MNPAVRIPSPLGGVLVALVHVVVPSLIGLATVAVAPEAARAQAVAQDDPEALLIEGVRLRRLGDEMGAVHYFEQAYKLAPSPRTAGQLGLCEMAVARFPEAEAHLAEALRSDTDPWVNTNRVYLSNAIKNVKNYLGTLEVVGRPEGAEVEIDGRTIGRLPLVRPMRLVSGREVFVRVSAPGYEPLRRGVQIQQRELTRVVIELEPIPTGEPVAIAPSDVGPPVPMPRAAMSAAPYSGQPGPGVDRAMLTPGGETGGGWKRPMAWISAGVTAALVGGGFMFLTTSNNRIDAFNSVNTATTTADHHCNRDAPQAGGGPCQKLLDQGNLARNLSVASFVAAGAAAGSSIYLFATAPAPGPRYALTCSPTLGGRETVGAACAWRF